MTRLTSIAVGGTLLGGYGGFAAIAGRFVYPAKPEDKVWLYVRDLASISVNEAMQYITPAGAGVTIARQGDSGQADDFIALSSTCPHLGCKVHWEGQNDRFFCPCHNGVFDPSGNPVSGPPADANQPLPRYPLTVNNGLLFIEVAATSLARAEAYERVDSPGHAARSGGVA